MKLSDAIVKGCELVSVHLRNSGYYVAHEQGFNSADVLLTALLGSSHIQEKVVLQAIHKGPTAACRTIQDGLMKTWRDLGARCPDSLTRAARKLGRPWPKRGEILMGYVNRLNDNEGLTREEIAGLLGTGGL